MSAITAAANSQQLIEIATEMSMVPTTIVVVVTGDPTVARTVKCDYSLSPYRTKLLTRTMKMFYLWQAFSHRICDSIMPSQLKQIIS